MNRQKAITLFKTISYIGIYGGLLMPLMFIPYVIFPFVFSKLIMFQILIGLTFPAYLALAWMEPKYRPPKSALYMAIIAYFAAIGLSVIFSTDIMRSWWGNQERMNGMFTLLHFLAWLTMAIGVLKTWVDWRRLLNYEVVLSVFMASVSLLQLLKKDLLIFTAGDRIGGLLDNPIYMGCYQMFNLSFLALLFMKTSSWKARAWYIIAALFDIAAFALTQSRGALVGLAAVIGTFALYYAIFTKNKKARWGILGGAGAFFGAYIVAYFFRDAPFIRNNEILNRLTHFTIASETRFIAWDIAWKGFLERPLTGWGFDAYHILFNLKYNPRSLEFSSYETWFDRAHNTVMDVLSMTGIFGFVAFFAIFVVLFISLWRARQQKHIDLPMAAVLTALPVGYFLQNLFVFDHPAAFSMSYLLFALVIAATQPGFLGAEAGASMQHAETYPKVPTFLKRLRESHPTPWTLFAVLQLLLLLVVWRFSVLPFKASWTAIHSNQLRAVSLDRAWDEMIKAGNIPTPYLDEQTFLLSRDLIAMAPTGQLEAQPRWREIYDHTKKISEQLIAEHPRNTHPLFIMARLTQEVAAILPPEEQSEEIALSERLYRAAIKTSPKRQQLYHSLARLYTMVGRPELAIIELEKALEFDENVGESWWYVGVTKWFNLNQPEEGMKAVVEALKAKTPYPPQSIRDASFAARAAGALGEKDLLKDRIFPQLSNLGGGTVDQYLDIARAFEQVGLIEERDSLLNALQKADPTVMKQLEPLRERTANTIDESIKMATPVPTEEATTST